jgi:hypothetical protein
MTLGTYNFKKDAIFVLPRTGGIEAMKMFISAAKQQVDKDMLSRT